MKNTLETRLGLFFALALVVGAIILEMLGGLDFFRGGTIVRARFNNVQELKVGDAVKMAGVRIGRVDTVKFDEGKVLVTMKVTDKTAVLRTDSRATIKFEGLMGQNYVMIDFGTPKGKPVETGFEMESYEQPDLSALMGKLDGVATGIQKVTANFSDFNLEEMMMPLVDTLKASRPEILAILTNMHHISGQIASGQGTVGKLIYDQDLYNTAMSTVTNLNETVTDARGALSAARLIVNEVNAGRGSIGKLVRDEKLYADLTEAAANLKEILQKANKGNGSVAKLLNDDALINNAKLTLQKLDKATEGLEDQGPLSLIGIAVGKLF